LNLKKIIFCIRKNLEQCWSAVLISHNHSITSRISLTKNGSNQKSILSAYGHWFVSYATSGTFGIAELRGARPYDNA
jgi:hypothetical protein